MWFNGLAFDKRAQPATPPQKMKPGTIACKVVAQFTRQIDAIIAEGGAFGREFDSAFSALVTNYALFTATSQATAHADCLACFPQLDTRWTR